MNLSEIFIRRPVMTTLTMVAIVIFGLMSYVLLPISDLPSIDFPTIQVSASLPGATPDTMAASVATPLEKQFSSIAGIDSFNSTSSLGSTNITLQFNLDRNITQAAKDVQAAINAAASELPAGLPRLPTYRKVNPSAAPILYLYLYSKTLPISTVDEYAEITVGQPISMVDGVAQVQVFGSKQYAVRVQVDPKELASRGVGIDQVQTALQSANVSLPTGILSGKYKSYIVNANGQLKDAAAYRKLIVSYKNGAAVRLEDVGQVIDSIQNVNSSNAYNGNPSVVLAIQRQPNTNTVAIVDAIKELMPTLREQVPQAIEMGIFYDRSESIRASVDDVKFTLLLTIFLVVMVIFIFLRNISATVIPSLALPIALIGTFAVMYLAGYSLDNLSLMALTLSVGFVVDDAVVVLENIVRYQEMGETPYNAALKGSREIGFTIVSMTLSLVAVFIPILFMGGILGKLFHEFAVTISVAILVSGFVSLSLTPMLCSRFLTSHHNNSNWFYRAFEWGFDLVQKVYASTLKAVLKYHILTLITSFVILVLTFYLAGVVQKGFVPTQDTGQITANTKAAQDISYEAMLKHQQAVVDIIRKDPNVKAVNSTVGAAGPNASVNSGRIIIRLKPLSQRRLSSDQIIQKLRPKVSKIPGLRVLMQSPPAIAIGGQQTNAVYQYTLQTLDSSLLGQYVPKLEEKMKTLRGLQDVNSTLELSSPRIQVNIDRNKASTLGVTASQVESALASAFSSGQVSLIYTPTDQFQVILEVLPQYQRDISAISSLYIRSSSGNLVPLSAVANFTQSVTPLSLNHQGEIPSATISYNLAPGTSLDEANQQITKLAASILPSTITGGFQGGAKAFQQSTQSLGLLLIVSIAVIYLILGILYEDFIHPLTILSGLPSAGFGAILTLILFDVELNVYSFIGIILLIGIVKKNGIMMVDFAIVAQRNESKTPYEAIYQACLVRFRPIMMTTMAALMGTLPIALGLGAGSEARRPLGIAVVGGLVFSQILTLYLTPVYYLYMEAFRNFLSKRKTPRQRITTDVTDS
ncbi:acriflavin resistance protein [Calothrix sp. NIES-4071]|nr:acriflavin resistance protein [Calothrix sp. NIES-4071]BAZ59888.1 acriflavin resistance protein [Calothrix sp. NIES-4105]